MPPLDILGSFADPKNLDQGAGKLVNVRVVPRETKEGKVAKVRLPQVCKPTSASCIGVVPRTGDDLERSRGRLDIPRRRNSGADAGGLCRC